MRISETSSPELQKLPHSHLISEIESLVQQCEHRSPSPPFPATLSADLRRCVSQLGPLSPFPNAVKLHLWKLSYRLWNACVDLSNAAAVVRSSNDVGAEEEVVKRRHVAADLLHLAGDVAGVPSPTMKSAFFYFKTGLLWHDLRNFDLALTCFEKATNLVYGVDIGEVSDAGERKLLLDLNVARSRTEWEVSDRNLAMNLLNRAKTLLFGSAEHYKTLANQYLSFGKVVLSNNEVDVALRLMTEGLSLCERGLSASRTRNETMDLKDLRCKCLRFIAAGHLQGGDFDSVLKCVRVLREDSGDHHPCLYVLAMKALLGLGRHGEAEKELKGMVVNKRTPEGVWVSAAEAYFEAVGYAGAETVKRLFLGLLGRCHVSAGAAVRVAYRVLGEAGSGSEGLHMRAKVVAELVADERVVALFLGEAAAKERTSMHAILWNCAADNFRSKDYKTSAEMFEKSMLYIPHGIEDRIVQSKGYRVLCLCHLGLSQLDSAQEYINEAEKLEPNIASAFLKFKIFLQKNDHNSAITQMRAMMTCLDFTPDFLSLAAHEAVACRALPVAVASLSNLLDNYSGEVMPAREAVVLRTLVTVLSQDPDNEPEILKYMKRAQTRISEVGSECFLGKGEVGRRELNWLAVTSWNIGTRTGKEKNYNLCAEFLRLASEFYSTSVDGEVEGNNVMISKSLILSVCAMIAFEKQRKNVLQDTEVKHAIELLDKAMKILTASTQSQLLDDQITSSETNLFFVYTFTAYDLYGRLTDLVPHQLPLVKGFATSKNCNPKDLLQIGLSASEGPRANLEVASFALNASLSAFLSSPSPDYKAVAIIIRRLIAVAAIYNGDTEDDTVYDLYKQASRVMVGLREGEYPIEEGKWLAMTAWNRAALPVRVGQIDAAKKWMNIGLELAGKVPRMETYRACMEEYMDTSFGRRSPGNNDGENRTMQVI